MTSAVELARRGEGRVEPNPMVGCVIVSDGQVVSEGWHTRFGGPHAEIEALREAGDSARGSTLYVTLEPCAHHGKTPPCVDAIVSAGVSRVVIGINDPNPAVCGAGSQLLRERGIQVDQGLLAAQVRHLNAPYLKLVLKQQPWVIAKWAMTLDGKISTAAGDSKWISNQRSRQIVHRLRGRVDAILVGHGTAAADDPMLTARAGALRTATRIVCDSNARLAIQSRLVQTARDVPVLIVAGCSAPEEKLRLLADHGCEVYQCPGDTRSRQLNELLAELGRRNMTNLLLEGGGELLGTALDARAIDEVHAFVAPKIIGGAAAKTPMAGIGLHRIADAVTLSNPSVEQLDGDIYVHGQVDRSQALPAP